MNNKPNATGYAFEQEWMPKDYQEHQFSEEFEQKMQQLIDGSIQNKKTHVTESEKIIFIQNLLDTETKTEEKLQHELDFLNHEGTKKTVIKAFHEKENMDISHNIPPVLIFGKDYKKKIFFIKLKFTTITLGFFLLLFNFFPYSIIPIDLDTWDNFIRNWLQNF